MYRPLLTPIVKIRKKNKKFKVKPNKERLYSTLIAKSHLSLNLKASETSEILYNPSIKHKLENDWAILKYIELIFYNNL